MQGLKKDLHACITCLCSMFFPQQELMQKFAGTTSLHHWGLLNDKILCIHRKLPYTKSHNRSIWLTILFANWLQHSRVPGRSLSQCYLGTFCLQGRHSMTQLGTFLRQEQWFVCFFTFSFSSPASPLHFLQLCLSNITSLKNLFLIKHMESKEWKFQYHRQHWTQSFFLFGTLISEREGGKLQPLWKVLFKKRKCMTK